MTDFPQSGETSPETPSGTPEEVLLPEYQIEDLPPALREGFARLGWTSMMPVQAKAIPYILAHRDVMIQSRTGSGKTGAYLTPILQRIDPTQNTTQALVLVPTRELALQVWREAQALGSAQNVRSIAVYGGVGYREQLDAFREGSHLVIGTPGRILDHLLRRSLTLNALKMIVFDEADRMLSMGFYPDMKRVQGYLPDRPVNTYMFSATYPPQVLSLAREFMRSPTILNLSSDHVHVTEVEHILYSVPPMDKERSLIRIIEIENPASAIVFCNTKERVHFVATLLQRYGYNAAEISSDLAQGAREDVMRRIREGRLRFLVATDVAARGIDIPELSHVFLYETPEDLESYIHRAGRTGRAGSGGVAVTLANSLEKVEVQRIRKRFSVDFQERALPTDEEVQNVVVQRTLALLEAQLRERDRLQTERMQRFLPYLNSLLGEPQEGEPNETLNGLAMLLDDFYHYSFHTAQLPQPEGEPPTSLHGQRSVPRRQSKERHSPRPAGEQSSAAQPADEPSRARPTGSAPSRRRRRGGQRRTGGA